ncbi:MAG: helix-turn-helix transcriptional regulator [Bacilli bacterium]|nr:helix-turn-helix transcriptional regulator [Bacilli bacterium]
MNYEKIGEFIASKRKEKDLTQKELAKKIGVTDKAVSRWERGLGCPDVSILELLSKELDVSILELLKGRKIENEVIKVTEADDYIKESYKESKNKFNKEIKKIVNILIIFLSSFLVFIALYFNVTSYLRLTKKQDMDFTYEYEDFNIKLGPGTSFYDNKAKLKKYIDIIENNQGKLTDEEYTSLLNYLKTEYEFISNSFIFKVNKLRYYSFNDIFVKLAKDYDKYNFEHLYFARIYQNYVGDISNTTFYSGLRGVSNAESEFTLVYNSNFENLLYFKMEDDTFLSPLFLLLDIVSNHVYMLNPILDMTEEIMNGADIHE